jgi:hypothetical protein
MYLIYVLRNMCVCTYSALCEMSCDSLNSTVSIIILKTPSTFLEICTKTLGHFAREGGHVLKKSNFSTDVYVLAPTCFGSNLPSSGCFLDPSELL